MAQELELVGPTAAVFQYPCAIIRIKGERCSGDQGTRLVLLERPGEPHVTSEVEPERVRAALDTLIA